MPQDQASQAWSWSTACRRPHRRRRRRTLAARPPASPSVSVPDGVVVALDVDGGRLPHVTEASARLGPTLVHAVLADGRVLAARSPNASIGCCSTARERPGRAAATPRRASAPQRESSIGELAALQRDPLGAAAVSYDGRCPRVLRVHADPRPDRRHRRPGRSGTSKPLTWLARRARPGTVGSWRVLLPAGGRHRRDVRARAPARTERRVTARRVSVTPSTATTSSPVTSRRHRREPLHGGHRTRTLVTRCSRAVDVPADRGRARPRRRQVGGVAVDADPLDVDTPARLFDAAEQQLGAVDILVNNATGWVQDTFKPAAVDRFDRPMLPVSADTVDRNLGVDARASRAPDRRARPPVRPAGATWARIVGLTSGGPHGFPEEVSVRRRQGRGRALHARCRRRARRVRHHRQQLSAGHRHRLGHRRRACRSGNGRAARGGRRGDRVPCSQPPAS